LGVPVQAQALEACAVMRALGQKFLVLFFKKEHAFFLRE
jgi:hypothetical protein